MALCKVKRPFQGREDECQLNLSPGDIVTLGNNTDIRLWVWASNGKAKEGYVPLDCIERLPDTSKAADSIWTNFCCYPHLIPEDFFPKSKSASSSQDKSMIETTPLLALQRFFFPPSNEDNGGYINAQSKSPAIEHRELSVAKNCRGRPFNDIPMESNYTPRRNIAKRYHHDPVGDRSIGNMSEYYSIKKKQRNYNPFGDEPSTPDLRPECHHKTTNVQVQGDYARVNKVHSNPFNDDNGPTQMNDIGLKSISFPGTISQDFTLRGNFSHNPFDDDNDVDIDLTVNDELAQSNKIGLETTSLSGKDPKDFTRSSHGHYNPFDDDDNDDDDSTQYLEIGVTTTFFSAQASEDSTGISYVHHNPFDDDDEPMELSESGITKTSIPGMNLGDSTRISTVHYNPFDDDKSSKLGKIGVTSASLTPRKIQEKYHNPFD